MHSRTLFCVILFLFVFGVLFGQVTAQESQFPYKARVTGDRVNIRSGPGTNYYRCGKVNNGDIVTVVDKKFSWARIMPTDNNFSWISKQYVDVKSGDASTGMVTGDNVRVWAGSPHLAPIYSTRLQLKLNEGDEVKLLGEESDGYYKISPPTGAYFWVSAKFLEEVEDVQESRGIEQPSAEPLDQQSSEQSTEPSQEPAGESESSSQADVSSGPLGKYYDLKDKLNAEVEKPVNEQNFSGLRHQLKQLVEGNKGSKASKYAKFTLNELERYTLAKKAYVQLRKQKTSLKSKKQQIEQETQQRLRQVKDMGKYAVIGVMEKSSIYDQQASEQYYRIVDSQGNIICYAKPAANMDVERYLGQKVGLVGTIEAHQDTREALIKFREIENL